MRPCAICEKPIRLQNRRYCSMACYEQVRSEQRLQRWLDGQLNPSDASALGRVPRWIKRWWFETFGERCSACGWARVNANTGKVPLEWDHVDGDCSNNRRGNLRLLCPNCHALTETHAALNYGRSKRRRKWAGVVVIEHNALASQ
ncbi:MAG TPA: HNH endonuclease signature motif containing protein [Chloroflexota bacterium]|nr:HNH endonuclease signature motif containing protein [Chloroflexota bacterium]